MDGSNINGSTGSILIDGMLAEGEYARTVNTNTHTNDEKVHVAGFIDSDSYSDEGSNCDTEDSSFVVDDEEISSLHEEEDESDFMIKYWKWESW